MPTGISSKIDPGPPLDKNISKLPPEGAKSIEKVPGSLDESLRALERDHDSLMRADVFTRT